MPSTTAKRYTVQHNGCDGTYHENLGWQVIDAQPFAIEFRVVMSGERRSAQRVARNLNARHDAGRLVDLASVVVDARIAAAPTHADEMDRLEAALAAGADIKDLLDAQSRRRAA